MTTGNTSQDAKTIFLVDDDSSTVNLYGRRLEQAGFRMASASGATEASEALPDLSADLIILDLMLPKPGGLELLKKIRSGQRHKDTPILVLSNSYLPELAGKALSAGGNKVLSKSECSSSELLSVSRELIGLGNEGSRDEASASRVSGADNSPAAALAEAALGAEVPEKFNQTFIEQGSTEARAIKEHCFRYVEVANAGEGKALLHEVYQKLRFLSAWGGLVGCGKIAQLTEAIAAMLFDRVFGSNHGMSPSSIQTLVQAVDCLERLFTCGNGGSALSAHSARVLLVDDDEVCNLANEMTLKRVKYDPVSAKDGWAALNLLEDNRFDLILLDIDMPGMNGFEVCQKLRNLPHHKHTPVVFVTLYHDFPNRARSVLSGGDDLISKPISPVELLVKATVFLLKPSRPQVPEEQPDIRNSSSESEMVAASSAAAPAWNSNSGSEDKSGPADSSSEPSQAEGATNKLDTLQEAVNEKLKCLQQALEEATKRRETAQKQAAENAKRRKDLEAAIEENQRCQQLFRQLVEESQKKASASATGAGAGHLMPDSRRRALLEMGDFVSDKLTQFKKALAEETKRRQALEEEVARNAKSRRELESALNEIQQIQDAFQQEVESADDPQQLQELEASRAQIHQARQKLERELEAAGGELQTLLEAEAARQAEFETRTKGLLASQADTEQKLQNLAEVLKAESSPPDTTEPKAGEKSQKSAELKAELQLLKQAKAQLRQELAEARKQRKAQAERAAAERSVLENRVQELQAAQAKLKQELQQKEGALAITTARRQAVKRRAAEHAKCRKQLEAALAENEQTGIALEREKEASESAKRRAELQTGLAGNKTNFEARVQELQTSQAAVEQQLKQVSGALASETQRRAGAEQQAAELAQDRSALVAELGRVQKQFEQTQKQYQELETSAQAEQALLQAKLKELQSDRATLEEKIKALEQALAAETLRRESAEQRVAELAQRQSELEAELAENKRLQANLRQELENTQNQLQAAQASSRDTQTKLEEEIQQLQHAQKEVEQRLNQLTGALAQESQRREQAEQEAGQIRQRRSELEAERNENKRLQASLHQELDHAQTQLRSEALARQELQQAQQQLRHLLELQENQQSQAQLSQQLEEAKAQLSALKEKYAAEHAGLTARTRELQGAQVAVDQEVTRLAEALAKEIQRRKGAEQQSGESGKRRSELEAELVETKNTREQLQNQLLGVQRQVEALEENYFTGQAELEARTQELQTTRTEVEEKVQSLTEALAFETKRREAIEGLAVEAFKQRRELEAKLAKMEQAEQALLQQLESSDNAKRRELEEELAKNQQEQALLRQQLEDAHQQLQAQKEQYLAEQSRLVASTEELRSAQADLEQKVKRITDALTEETRRREAADQQASRIGQDRSQLEAALTDARQAQAGLQHELEIAQKQLQAQQESNRANETELQALTGQLQTAQAGVEEQIKQLTENLAAEAKRRGVAEQQTGELGQKRRELENQLANLAQQLEEAQTQLEEETQMRQQLQQAQKQLTLFLQLAENQQTHSELQQHLEEAQRQLQTQREQFLADQSKLEAQTKELQAAQVAVQQQIATLTDALAQEIKRREEAKQEAGESDKRRSELEAELAKNKEAQARLLQQLEDDQHKALDLKEIYAAGRARLEAQARELQAAQAPVEQNIQSLTEALAFETKRREAVERLAADSFKQRRELAAQLAKLQEAEKGLQRELEAPESAKRRSELEAQLEQGKQAQAQLRQQLGSALKKLLAAQAELNLKAPPSAEAEAEPNRRVEPEPSTPAGHRGGLHALREFLTDKIRFRQKGGTGQTRSGENVRPVAAATHQHHEAAPALPEALPAQPQLSGAAPSAVKVQAQQIQINQNDLLRRILRLTESLTKETKLREGAEKQVGQLEQTRSELEAQLKQTRDELEKQLQTQHERSRVEWANLETRIKELQAAQVPVELQLKQVTDALAEEVKRREDAEQQTHELGQRRSQLEDQRAQLAQQLQEAQHQLQVQKEDYLIKQSRLEARAHELEAAKAAVQQEVASLTNTLAEEIKQRKEAEHRAEQMTDALGEESKHRKLAEQQAGELGQRRSELDAQLAQARQQLEAAQKQLQSETQVRQEMDQSHQELNQLLQLTDNQQIQEQVKTLTDALAFETKRREAVDRMAADAFKQRRELEAIEKTKSLEKSGQLVAEVVETSKHGRTGILSLVRRFIECTIGRLVTRPREEAKPQVAEISQPRAEKETETPGQQPLVVSSPAELRPKQLTAQPAGTGAESVSLAARAPQARAPILGLLERLKRVTESLAQETKRREDAERQASHLEGELASNKQRHSKLQHALQQAQKAGLDTLRKTSNELQVIQSALVERVRELGAEPDGTASHAPDGDTVAEAKVPSQTPG